MRKYFYILITLLAVLSIGFVGCKNKPTAVADFIDKAKEASTKDFTPKSDDKMKVKNSGYSFVDYVGNYFVSVKEYYISGNSGKTFRYSLEIKQSGNSTTTELKGYNNGEAFTKTYLGGGNLTTGNKFVLGFGGPNFIQFPSTNATNQYAFLTADGLNNLKLAISNK